MKKIKNSLGFTLVELLIVIGLLGAIALIVIAAINPIEQSNRARDTRFKADAGQLISAIDRYYVANSEFPWMTVTPATYDSVEDTFGFLSSDNQNVGLCGASCAADDGVLITTNELKTEFRNRDFVQNAADGVEKQIMIGKATGSSASVYGCFIPLAYATKKKALADAKVYTLSAATGDRTPTVACATPDVSWSDVTDCYVCVPE